MYESKNKSVEECLEEYKENKSKITERINANKRLDAELKSLGEPKDSPR